MKTVFYLPTSNEKALIYINNIPCEEFLTIEGMLYEPNGNILKYTIDENRYVKNLSINYCEDKFADNTITRNIIFYKG